MLVVNRNTLVAIHLLNFFYQVHLCFTGALNFQKFLRIERTIGKWFSSFHVAAIFDAWHDAATGGQEHQVLFALIVDDVDRNTLAFVFADANNTCGAGQASRTTWSTCFEEFNNAWQTTSDVFSCNTTSVERTHGELCTRLTNGLSGNNTNCFTKFNRLTCGK